MKENVLKDKSYKFSLRIVALYKYLVNEKREYVMSKQILRSGTSIGAMIREAEFGQSMPDFISKMTIALKETNETDYWLNVFKESNYLTVAEFNNISIDCIEILKLLVTSIKTSKAKS
jgi:four helix bundle protein